VLYRFPSPSLAAPLLSASPSPAFGPWGIPFFVLELEELGAGVEVVAGGDEDDVAGVLDEDVAGLLDEEPPPQPAAASPRTTSASAGNSRRFDRLLIRYLRG
jgi:hypothetical protein